MSSDIQKTQVAEAQAQGLNADAATGEIKAETTGNVVPTGNGALPASADDLAMMMKHAGKQTFSVRELLVPVFKIANTTTAEFKRSAAEYIPGIEEGDMFDSLTRQIRKGKVPIIVVRFMTVYIESKPNMGPTVKLWGTDRSGYDRAVGGDVGVRLTKDGNEIREVGSYYILVVNEDGTSLPAMMYLGSTGWKEARRLNALLGSFELPLPDGSGVFTAPPYAKIYFASTVPDSNEKNTWMAFHFDMGPLTLAHKFGRMLYAKAHAFEESVDKGLVKVVGEMEDDRRTETDGKKAAPPRETGNSGPPADNAPPPAGEDDYGGSPSGGQSNATVAEAAKKAAF